MTKNYFQHRPDAMSEEIVTALLSGTTFDFHELFRVVHHALRARKAVAGGEETLRLRAYEKLQNFVKKGLVKKSAKQYSGVPDRLRSQSLEMAAAREQIKSRQAARRDIPMA